LWGVFERDPQLARDGIRLRQFGQQIIERLGVSAFTRRG